MNQSTEDFRGMAAILYNFYFFVELIYFITSSTDNLISYLLLNNLIIFAFYNCFINAIIKQFLYKKNYRIKLPVQSGTGTLLRQAVSPVPKPVPGSVTGTQTGIRLCHRSTTIIFHFSLNK